MTEQTIPPIHISLRHAAPAFCYRVAGGLVWSDVRIGFLEMFRTEGAGEPGVAFPQRASPGTGRTVHSATGWLAGAQRRVECTAHDAGFELDVDGIGVFSIDRASGDILCRRLNAHVGCELLEECLLGPPLAFALLGQGTWCLHASAVLKDGRASLFLGASGAGKSTLAAFLDETDGVIRLGDDIAPLSMREGQAHIHPHFPQLKLAERQYPAARPASLPVRNIFLLEAAGPDEAPCLDSLATPGAVKALAGQTVAVKLFDREMHQAHLHFVAGLLGGVSVCRMVYPHNNNSLGWVSNRVSDIL